MKRKREGRFLRRTYVDSLAHPASFFAYVLPFNKRHGTLSPSPFLLYPCDSRLLSRLCAPGAHCLGRRSRHKASPFSFHLVAAPYPVCTCERLKMSPGALSRDERLSGIGSNRILARSIPFIPVAAGVLGEGSEIDLRAETSKETGTLGDTFLVDQRNVVSRWIDARLATGGWWWRWCTRGKDGRAAPSFPLPPPFLVSSLLFSSLLFASFRVSSLQL